MLEHSAWYQRRVSALQSSSKWLEVKKSISIIQHEMVVAIREITRALTTGNQVYYRMNMSLVLTIAWIIEIQQTRSMQFIRRSVCRHLKTQQNNFVKQIVSIFPVHVISLHYSSSSLSVKWAHYHVELSIKRSHACTTARSKHDQHYVPILIPPEYSVSTVFPGVTYCLYLVPSEFAYDSVHDFVWPRSGVSKPLNQITFRYQLRDISSLQTFIA